MFKRILIAYSGSIASEHALKLAFELARLSGASLTALSVEEKLPAYAASVGEVEEAKLQMDAYFSRLQEEAQVRARSAGVTLDTIVLAGQAAQTIVRYADEEGFDLIVVGADGGRGLGGTADRVAELAHCPVLIARSSLLAIQVRDVMSKDVAAVPPGAPLAELVELLVERQLKAVPVVEAGKLVGIVTGGDLLQRAGMGLRLSLQRSLPPEMVAELAQSLASGGKTAADVMSAPVVSIREKARVAEAVRLMTDKRLKRLPVVDERGALVGMVSRFDVLAAFAGLTGTEATLPAAGVTLPSTAGDLMFREVPTTTPDASVSEVLRKLVSTPLRRVVVVDASRHVLGIIIDSSLLARLQHQAEPGTLRAFLSFLSRPSEVDFDISGTAADVMERRVYMVRQDAPLSEVLQMMLANRVKRLVVVDSERRLVGMVDRDSLLRAISRGIASR